mgnify:CR=1 FL=1
MGRSSPKARQAKSKARIERYEQMAAEARSFEKASVSDITIPVPPRLGAKVIEAKHIRKAFGDRVLIDDLSFTLPRNGIVGVIGPNGVGKSTLFKTIVGLEPLTSGDLKIGETVKISYVDQNRAGLDPNKNLWEAVSDGNDFIDRPLFEVQKKEGTERRLVGFELTERGIPRHGYALAAPDGRTIGAVTSGTMSPTLKKGIGMGYVQSAFAAPGTDIDVVIRNKPVRARVVKMPFLKRREAE